jgi:hypothetical protein
MDTLARLLTYQKSLFKEIGKAAGAGDARALLGLQGKLATTEKLIREEKEIVRQLEVLIDAPGAPSVSIPPRRDSADDGSSSPSAREQGRRRRTQFLKEAESKGVVLQQVTGTIYQTRDGTRVGIASATEGKNGDRWFLDLREGEFDHAVLLCEPLDGELTHFSLPKKFMDEFGHHFSRAGDRIKFNVHKRGGAYMLLVPRKGPVNIDAYRDNFFGLGG